MNDFELAVAVTHHVLVAAGHGWAQPRKVSEAEKFDAAKLPFPVGLTVGGKGRQRSARGMDQ